MQLRCPNCQHAVEVEGSGAFESIECPSCGSALDLLAEPTSTLATMRSIGHFELLDPLGAGAFGVVWKARDTQLDRLVAIKIPRIGLHDLDHAESFLREARAAAQLRHPHIVAVHEVGRENGTLYIVSDFIQGKTLAERLAAGPFTPREAAQLLVQIADALHHAHEAGVIHRDLKPQNIMLDGEDRPQLMDFGLAKREAGEITMTIEGRMLGTPAYMSPEQARGEGHHVDRRTDVYSLGVVLFELLTGERPFRGNIQTVINQVINDEPPSPRKLNSRIPLDMETICLKCLEKVPARRFGSAQVVARELRSFLAGKPIQARPIWQVTRFWRLCRRHPITSSAIGVMVLTGLIALVAVSTALVHSNRSLRREAAALAKSEQSLQEALAAVNDLLTTVSENKLLNQPGMQAVRRDLLNTALSYYERFLQQHDKNPRIESEVAAAQYRVGRIALLLGSMDDALTPLNAARQMQERLLAEEPNSVERLKALGDTMSLFGQIHARQRELEASNRDYHEAIRLRERLAATSPQDIGYQRGLANAHMNAGLVALNIARANAETDAAFNEYLSAARRELEVAQRIRLAILPSSENDTELRRDLGKGYFNLGDLAQVEDRVPDAINQFKQGANVFERLLQEEPADLENRSSLAVCLRLVGNLLASHSQPAEARQWYQRAIGHLSPLVSQNPDVPEYRAHQADLYLSLFGLEKGEHNGTAGQLALEQARKDFAHLAERYPAIAAYQRGLAVTLRELAHQQRIAGDSQMADNTFNEAIRIFKELVRQFPQEGPYRVLLKETEAESSSPQVSTGQNTDLGDLQN